LYTSSANAGGHDGYTTSSGGQECLARVSKVSMQAACTAGQPSAGTMSHRRLRSRLGAGVDLLGDLVADAETRHPLMPFGPELFDADRIDVLDVRARLALGRRHLELDSPPTFGPCRRV
jgi:hypothetical protein